MSDPGSVFSVSVAGNVEGHLIVGTGNQLVTDAEALLGPPEHIVLGTPLWNVPSLPSRIFLGRDDDLAALDAPPPGAVAVHGLAGTGKTELVLQYAFGLRAQYPLIWWIVADEPERIEAGLVALTSAVAARIGKVPPARAVDAAGWAIGYLSAHPGWLLVLDNVEEPAAVESLLARVSGGRVLITSNRDVDWDRRLDAAIRLDVLAPDPAAALLGQQSRQDDPLTADRLAGELGRLPLALAQVGSYLAQTRTPMAAYLDRLADAPTSGSPQETIARVWDVTLARITADQPAAIDLLRVLSAFGSDAVPRTVLERLSDNPVTVDAALGVLHSYSLITLTEHAVSTHRLVQAAVAGQARTAGAWPDVLARALAALRRARPVGDPQIVIAAWPQWAMLLPHIEALARHWPEDRLDHDFAVLLGVAGVYARAQGTLTTALALDRRSLTMVEAVYGPDHPEVATALSNTAVVLQDLGRPDDAVPLFRRALTITESTVGTHHPDFAIRLANLAFSLGALGRNDEALVLEQQALAISEATLGSNHTDVAIRLANLARSLADLGREREAIVMAERAVAIAEAAYGPDHPEVASRLDSLAYCLWRAGRPADAVVLEQRALAISEASLGPEHPDLAIRLDSLGVSLAELDRDAEAATLQERAVAITVTVLGADHPSMANRLNNLAVSLAGTGRNGDAFPMAVRAVAIAEATLPSGHPTIDAMRAVRDGIGARLQR